MFQKIKVSVKGDKLHLEPTHSIIKKSPTIKQKNRKKTYRTLEIHEMKTMSGSTKYLKNIPVHLRPKCQRIVTLVNEHIDPNLLKCHVFHNQVSSKNIVLPGAQLDQILVSLVSKKDLALGEGYFLQYLKQYPSIKKLFSNAKQNMKLTFLENSPSESRNRQLSIKQPQKYRELNLSGSYGSIVDPIPTTSYGSLRNNKTKKKKNGKNPNWFKI